MSAKQVYVTRPLRDYRLYFNRDDAIDAANPFSIYARENFENGCGLSLPVGTLDPVPLTIHFAFKHTKRKLAKRQAP